MSISFAVALAGTVLAAVGTGLAIRLCVRKPRADMVAWVLALAGLTVALAAQAAGYRRGFVPTTFRATQLGGALVRRWRWPGVCPSWPPRGWSRASLAGSAWPGCSWWRP